MPYCDMASCAKISVLILVTLSCCLAAPTTSQSNFDLWHNPCSGQVARPIRHARSTSADMELKFLMENLNKSLIREMKKLYPKNARVGMKHVKGNCPKYNKLVQPISNAATVADAYKNFHLAMYQLAVFLDALRNIHINTTVSTFNPEKRLEIFNSTKSSLKLAICEFHETVKRDYNVVFASKPPKVKKGCLPKTANLGEIQMLDIQFVKKLKKVIRKGRKILAQKKKNELSHKRTKGEVS
ncbi:uncharacterized protein LOC126733995 isoform X2 [Anthonomus grandis grandis]|uniref:uncharacterized protein LOC126733995 isoform X2 n=1 Tax=Anthonomus grandis grandis TaxID=2921223 RepID=UPI002165100F|nr:uncharacterized protein LOC126733995 isoform X2 [Anthonomus grandis grandis]